MCSSPLSIEATARMRLVLEGDKKGEDEEEEEGRSGVRRSGIGKIGRQVVQLSSLIFQL